MNSLTLRKARETLWEVHRFQAVARIFGESWFPGWRVRVAHNLNQAMEAIRNYLPKEDDSLQVARIKRNQLRYLRLSGAPCEVCNKSMHDHPWADLESNGFVVWCPFTPKGYRPVSR